MRVVLVALLTALVGACSTAIKMDAGQQQTIGDRLVVTLDSAWNRVVAPGLGPAQTWTMEGLPVDQLLIYSGIKDDEAIHAETSGSQAKSFRFRSSMQPDEIAALFEGMYSRDGSSFKLVKLEPSAFGGSKGLRLEYAVLRKEDNVQLSGVGYAAVSNGELFAILYSAPRLEFFPRYKASAEYIARTARINLR